ncbi:hypothetical protein ILT44_26570 [Microvirga sp. BT689]|uniref:hypothetical protein n=1 Tax=Microvirga arvi TaxID=2778731 RepID=UPI00194DB3DA|nr:hypothetical protein [Microvirga arvi]MBM6583771.1 hypothetical protein [Microvirga arvi]
MNTKKADHAYSLGNQDPQVRSFLVLLVGLFSLWAVVTFIFLLPNGISTTFNYYCEFLSDGITFSCLNEKAISLFATNSQIQEHFGFSDGGSYARGGALLLKTGSPLSPGETPLWSPGMFWIHALILKVVGPSGPAVLGLVLVSGFSWAIFCTLFSIVMYQITARPVGLLAPITIFIFPATQEYLLNIGIFYSETVSVALFGSALLLTASAAMFRDWRMAVVAGISFTAAAYLRSSFEIVMHPAAVLLVVFWGACILILILGRRDSDRLSNGRKWTRIWIERANSRSFADFKIVAIVFVTFYALTLPYRLLNLERHGSASWVFGDYYFAYPWLTDGEYTQVQSFVLRGGGNVACRIDRQRCEEFATKRRQLGAQAVPIKDYKAAFYDTATSSPIAWLREKAPVIVKFWFSRPTFGAPVQGPYWPGILAAALIAASVLLATYLVVGYWLFWPTVFIGGYLGGSLVIWNLVHLEVRYVYPAQVLSPVLAAIALVVFLSTLPGGIWRRAHRKLPAFTTHAKPVELIDTN